MSRILLTLLISAALIGCGGGGDGSSDSSPVIVDSTAVFPFYADMNRDNFPYGFPSYKFGYTDDPIQTFHEPGGGVNGSGCHRIPLGGPSRTNFDVFFGQDIPYLQSYYLRFYLRVNATFDVIIHSNWKLAYNYTESAAFWLWMHATDDGQGLQPGFFSAHPQTGEILGNQVGVPTFYLDDFREQWICFEYHIDLDAHRVRLWITTEDGRYNETLYIDSPFYADGTRINEVKIGAYWDGQGDDNYFMLDEVAISDHYNGPVR